MRKINLFFAAYCRFQYYPQSILLMQQGNTMEVANDLNSTYFSQLTGDFNSIYNISYWSNKEILWRLPMTSRLIGKSGSLLALKTHWGQSPPYVAQIKKEITMKVIMHQSHSQLLNFWAQWFKESFHFTVIYFLQTSRIPLWVLQRHNHGKIWA